MAEEITGMQVIYSLFNSVIYKEYKLNTTYFSYYRKRNIFLNENSLVDRLLFILDTTEYDNITDDLILLSLIQDGKTTEEAKDILLRINAAKDFNKDEVKRYKEHFQNCCSKGYIEKHRNLLDEPMEFMKAMQQFTYLSDHSDKLWYKVFSELDFSSLDQELNQKGVKSTFDFINDSYPTGQYPLGQIVAVCAAPSTGKSLFLQQEAVTMCQQNVKVHYIALGDLTEARIAVRMVALALNVPLAEVTRNLSFYSDKVAQMFKDYLRITVVPSSEIHIDEYIEFALGYLKDCDVLMIDYDSNFAQDTDQMYTQGRSVYDKLTKISQQNKLVFIATQPKQCYYKEEHMPMDAPGESSGKMQVVDMLINIGRNPNSKVRMGYFEVPKNRNGEPNYSAPWIACNDGSFYICDEMLYMKYYKETNKRLSFSRHELDMEKDLADLDKIDNMTSTLRG